MSWDIFIQDIPENAASVDEIPDDFEPRSLGSRAAIVRRIRDVFPAAHFSDLSRGSFECLDFSIEFNVGAEEEVMCLGLHVRGEDVAADLFNQCGWRAFDPASDSGIFDPTIASDSFRKWREFRNRVVADDAG